MSCDKGEMVSHIVSGGGGASDSFYCLSHVRSLLRHFFAIGFLPFLGALDPSPPDLPLH